MGKGDGNIKWSECWEIVKNLGRFSADIEAGANEASSRGQKGQDLEECVTDMVVEGGSSFFTVGTGEEVVTEGVKLVRAVLA